MLTFEERDGPKVLRSHRGVRHNTIAKNFDYARKGAKLTARDGARAMGNTSFVPVDGAYEAAAIPGQHICRRKTVNRRKSFRPEENQFCK